jgi:tRNA threonylcarbamoyladenosine biosynthesis protein TsaB
MRVVGIDTATRAASVALIEDGRLIAERIHPVDEFTGDASRLHNRGNHAETILPLIESLFVGSKLSLGDVNGVALSIGPGSFTGLRIGLSTVKGLAYGWRLPVVGVSTLLAYAARVTGYQGLICSLLDARKSEVYVALFEKADCVLKRLTQDTVLSIADAVTTVGCFQAGRPCLFVGGGADVHKRLLLDLQGGRVLPEARSLSSPTVAATVAHLSENQFRSNQVEDLGSLIPVYIRPPEAEFKRRSLA